MGWRRRKKESGEEEGGGRKIVGEEDSGEGGRESGEGGIERRGTERVQVEGGGGRERESMSREEYYFGKHLESNNATFWQFFLVGQNTRQDP